MRVRTLCLAVSLALAATAAGAAQLSPRLADGSVMSGARAAQVNTLLDRWQAVVGGGNAALWREMMAIQLSQVSAETLARLETVGTGSDLQMLGQQYQAFIRVLGDDIAGRLKAKRQAESDAAAKATTDASGARLAGQPVAPKTLGSTTIDQTFIPITPCRVVDTRNVGGAIGAFGTRNFFFYTVLGSWNWFTSQGGVFGAASSVCPETFFTYATSAAVATVTVTGQGGAGNLIVWGGENPVASASTLSYSATGDIANTTVIPWGGRTGTGPGGSVLDFAVKVNAPTAAQVVVDVVGYFTAPQATALQCSNQVAAGTAGTVANNATFSVSLPACPAGYTRTGAGCNVGFGSFGVQLFEISPQVWGDCIWRNTSGGNIDRSDYSAESMCCRVPGR
jgi:hypothetical protein